MKMVCEILVAGAVGVGTLLAGPAFGQVIRLEKRAVVEAHSAVRLGNIATIKGTDTGTAATLANTLILSDVSTGHTINADAVLMAVIAQLGPGGISNQLQIAGSATCEVVVGEDASKVVATPVPVAMPMETEESPSVVTASVTSDGTEPEAAAATLSQVILARVEEELQVGAEDVRVSFDTINPVVDQPVAAGSRWQVYPRTRTFLGTVPFEAELISGTHVAQRVVLQAQVQKRIPVLVATTQIHSGTIVTADCFRVTDAWLDRNIPTYFNDAKAALGLQAQREVSVGDKLDQRDFKPVEMAARGDAVTVVFVSGALKVQMNGRAMASGKFHDQINVRNENTNQEYLATLIGKNLAVVGGTLTDAQEKQLRETR